MFTLATADGLPRHFTTTIVFKYNVETGRLTATDQGQPVHFKTAEMVSVDYNLYGINFTQFQMMCQLLAAIQSVPYATAKYSYHDGDDDIMVVRFEQDIEVAVAAESPA